MKSIYKVLGLSSGIMLLFATQLIAGKAEDTAKQIRVETIRPNNSKVGHPLPLACTWVGAHAKDMEGWGPDNQMRLIGQGHHLLPGFAHPSFPEMGNPPVLNFFRGEGFNKYYEAAIKRAAALKLPIVFIGSQWEALMGKGKGKFFKLPADKNPNVISLDGSIQNKVSPFGPIKPWREVGRLWTNNPNMKKLQEWYPNPPRIIFLSNNEHHKLHWTEVEKSKRYMDKYGNKKRSKNFKRKVVGDGWIKCYRALQEGMRDGLVNKNWQKNTIFIAYHGDAGDEFMGRWGGWRHYSLGIPGRFSPGPLMWDGGSASYYTHHWNPSTDFKTWSPQVEFQNVVSQNQLGLKSNPDFWFEISTWDGNAKGPKDKRKFYKNLGQTFTPERYAGMIQFGMWMLRPRAVREYRGWTESWEKQKPYFMSIVNAVDRIYNNSTLRQWWRKGKLVPNRAHEHPYQSDIPLAFDKEDRWFLLDADVNPQIFPWEMFWEIKVFALAMVQGKAPGRKWLIYAHSPLAERKNVKLTVPEYGDVKVDVSVGGSFYEITEKDKIVRAIK